jgi:hypothetical protein
MYLQALCRRDCLMPLVRGTRPIGAQADGSRQCIAQVIAFAQRQKDAANELYKRGRTAFALRKYKRVLAVVQSCRNVDTQAQSEKLEAAQAALLANIAAVLIHDGVRTHTELSSVC